MPASGCAQRKGCPMSRHQLSGVQHLRPRHSLTSLACLLALGLALTACGSSSSGASKTAPFAGKRLGISVCCPQPQIDVIANAITDSVKKDKTGLKATVVNGQASTQKAMQDVQTLLAQGYDAVWTTLISGQGYDNLAAQAAAKHLPWVNFSGSAVTGATMNIVIPESQLGYAVGVATADWMQAHQQQGAAIGATFDSTGANVARTDGFIAGVHSKLPDVKVYKVGNDKPSTTVAAGLGANLLQAHPDIRVLFGWTADDGVGLLQAAKEAGNSDPDKFLVATDEGNDQVYQLVGSKSLLQLAASLGYPFGAIAGEIQLEKALRGEKIPPTAVMRPTLVTPDNVTKVQEQEAHPFDYPDRISSQLAFVGGPLKFGELPTEDVDPVTP
jgi:ABC-type sugar transport system substrate-binding protein